MTNVRQLTFEGRRAGEGYFSQDGSLLVFQSEREPGNPFFQIYLMDLTTGDVERISPGYGKATCAWIAPDNRHVLYASTHDDPQSRALQEQELEARAAGKEKRYSWDYDEHFELYLADRQTGESKRLTHARGYDAECSLSPDGRRIVFSSNRHAYAEPLSEADAKAFEIDKSLMLDIYMMDIDGGNLRRLTTARGYDGGPFFSADGSMICWRRFSEDGATAEVYVANADGSDQRQVTRLGAMSWAPFFHPSGEYLIFTTNRHGFANFELYIVRVDGGDPVRVTYTAGFDGLPAFSPDGKRLTWTSNRGQANKQGQIFLANWNHQEARRLLGLDKAAADAAAQVENPVRPVTVSAPKTSPEILAGDIKAHVARLASDEFDGRLTGTPGERLATQYVADCFQRMGLLPMGDDGTYFQEFEFTAGVGAGPDCRLTLQDAEGKTRRSFEVDTDWRPLAYSASGVVEPAEVVFAGYGILAPAENPDDEYDSFVHLDVADKWVLVLRYMPEGFSPERRQKIAHYTGLRYKATVLRNKGARGMIVVSGPNSGVREQLVKMSFDASSTSGSFPAISITDEAADALLAASGKTIKQLQDALDTGEPQMGFAIEGVRLAANIDIQRERRVGRNVLARLASGRGIHAAPALVIGAHVDHLGHGIGSGSLARDDEKGMIHYGADDNASGTAALLEIAEHLTAQVAAGKLKPTRDIIFAAWSGEELGLLGSNHFVTELGRHLGDESDIHDAVAAYLNMDMVGRLRDELIVQGVASSSIWPQEIERRNVPVGLKIATQNDTYLPTDATSFYVKGVPMLAFFTGSH
ncbi:MAG: M28 family peptidase, partial [Planctomycetota bacterium]